MFDTRGVFGKIYSLKFEDAQIAPSRDRLHAVGRSACGGGPPSAEVGLG